MVKIVVSDVVIATLVIIVIGLSVWIAVSNRPNKKPEEIMSTLAQTEDYSTTDVTQNYDSVRNPHAKSTMYDLPQHEPPIQPPMQPPTQLPVQPPVQPPIQPPTQPAASSPRKEERPESRAYDPNEKSSGLIDSDAVVEDELTEGVYGIYLQSDEGRVASVDIDNVLNESTNMSIVVPKSYSDAIVILCRGYQNYTYNWYRYGGGKRQGCGVVDDDQIVIPCEFRPGQSFCNVRICLLGHESEVNLDLKMEE